jgi:[protein-PII] uridylyltransferase
MSLIFPETMSSKSSKPNLPDSLSRANLPWSERRELLRTWLRQNPVPNIPLEEMKAHCDTMPPHYWESVSPIDLVWGIQAVHSFFEIISRPDVTATTPFLDWRPTPDSECVRVMLCTWDRHGLLAKAAAALSALNISIVQADVYTRTDNVALDTFHVARAKGLKPIDAQVQDEVGFLLAGALSEPPRFASVWAYSRHKYLARPAAVPPHISFDIGSDPENTIVSVEATDRLGFLYDLLQALADLGLEIKRARVSTHAATAKDQFCVTDTAGQKVTDRARLDEIRRRLQSSLA